MAVRLAKTQWELVRTRVRFPPPPPINLPKWQGGLPRNAKSLQDKHLRQLESLAFSFDTRPSPC